MTRKGARRKTALFLLDISQSNSSFRPGMLTLVNHQSAIHKNIFDTGCKLMRTFIDGFILDG
jgi:hypothetical protein